MLSILCLFLVLGNKVTEKRDPEQLSSQTWKGPVVLGTQTI